MKNSNKIDIKDDLIISQANSDDMGTILDVQKKAFITEAELYGNYNINPITQTLEDLIIECKDKIVLKATIDNKIVGTIRANKCEEGCWINKLAVLPEYRGLGIGNDLLNNVQEYFLDTKKFILGTGVKSTFNIKLYEKNGFRIIREISTPDEINMVIMEKTIENNL
jgi:ribosomal protein S18 acetylase RimI-like enzyme